MILCRTITSIGRPPLCPSEYSVADHDVLQRKVFGRLFEIGETLVQRKQGFSWASTSGINHCMLCAYKCSSNPNLRSCQSEEVSTRS